MTTEARIAAVVANGSGEIFELEEYGAVGMAGASMIGLTTDDTIPMPHGSELMFLPDRVPVLLNLATGAQETVAVNPYDPAEAIYPVAVFNSPGYVNTLVSAYKERPAAKPLPLFAYGAVGWHADAFRSAALRIDTERRQDLRLMDPALVKRGIERYRRELPRNRLRRHLENCAVNYGCPAAKNFFIGRCEAPLPTARQCNARCLGCISLQENSDICSPQHRIDFTPTPEEIAAVALAHIHRVDRSVVSFGQGCEGDPLFAAKVIGPAIRTIRRQTNRGTINMNTNGSQPAVMARLQTDGLDSVRISLNSARPAVYETYFRPINFHLDDVKAGIDQALRENTFVSLNYLNCPGVSDAPEEIDALLQFLACHPVNMIQWRNLNFDPLRYWQAMSAAAPLGPPQGVARLIKRVAERFPQIRAGYFNPPKETFLE